MGQVRASMFLPAGYVKLEGATVNRSNYPRLVALADAYSLWTDDTTANPGLFGEGDGSTTMVLPNWTGRMAQFAATAGGAVAAGLPNVTGQVFNWFAGASSGGDPAGAIYDTNIGTGTIQRGGNEFFGYLYFDASRSNPIYSASTTVQPPAINVYPIMRY